jgi:hypothetical protein
MFDAAQASQFDARIKASLKLERKNSCLLIDMAQIETCVIELHFKHL